MSEYTEKLKKIDDLIKIAQTVDKYSTCQDLYEFLGIKNNEATIDEIRSAINNNHKFFHPKQDNPKWEKLAKEFLAVRPVIDYILINNRKEYDEVLKNRKIKELYRHYLSRTKFDKKLDSNEKRDLIDEGKELGLSGEEVIVLIKQWLDETGVKEVREVENKSDDDSSTKTPDDLVGKTYYEILGVPENADYAQIKDAYDKEHKKYIDARNKAVASARFFIITEGWECLKDPVKRKDYDAKLKIKREDNSKFSTVLDFRSGENAKSLLEAANLIDKYWDEGKRKLTTGDLAGWLGRNGNSVLADEVRAIEQTEENKDIALEKVIQALKVGKEKPAIKIEPSALEIGRIEWGKSIVKTIKILNDGARGYLYGDVNVFPSIKGVAFSQNKIGLFPGQYHEIEVQIDARNIPINKYNIKMSFATNANSTEVPFSFRVSSSIARMIGRSVLAGLVFGGALGFVRKITHTILSTFSPSFKGSELMDWVSWSNLDKILLSGSFGKDALRLLIVTVIAGIFLGIIGGGTYYLVRMTKIDFK